MRSIFKKSVVIGFALVSILASQLDLANANGVLLYHGNIQLFPGQAHAEPINGLISVGYADEQELKSINLLLEKQLFGRKEFLSVESLGSVHSVEGVEEQLLGAYKLDLTPHRFYFAFIVNKVSSPDDCKAWKLEEGTECTGFVGTYYRVEEHRNVIAAQFSNIVDRKTLPESWIPVGRIRLVKIVTNEESN
jgi:hypothetical protein